MKKFLIFAGIAVALVALVIALAVVSFVALFDQRVADRYWEVGVEAVHHGTRRQAVEAFAGARRYGTTSRFTGKALLLRYCDDFVVGFQREENARRIWADLMKRLGKFSLALHEEKTRLIEFGRIPAQRRFRSGQGRPETFAFLGFTHYCGKTKDGHFKVKRRTSRKKLGRSLREFSDWACRARQKLRKGEMLKRARTRVQGHLNYYAITDNAQQCSTYVYRATRILHKWLNRKSQRKAYTWAQFHQALTWVGWPGVRIRKDLNPCRRAEAC